MRDGALAPSSSWPIQLPAGGSRPIGKIARHSVVGRPRSTRPKRSKERRRRGPNALRRRVGAEGREIPGDASSTDPARRRTGNCAGEPVSRRFLSKGSAPSGMAIPLDPRLPAGLKLPTSGCLGGEGQPPGFAPAASLFGIAPGGAWAVPLRLPVARWALTPPFHPYAPVNRDAGFIFCGAFPSDSLRPGVTRHHGFWESGLFSSNGLPARGHPALRAWGGRYAAMRPGFKGPNAWPSLP